jgi:hypothetical protein
VELGGKLFASEQLLSKETANKTRTANALKINAKASFSKGIYQLNAEGKHEDQKQKEEMHQNSRMQSTLSWEAQGGDTTLCNEYNPPPHRSSLFQEISCLLIVSVPQIGVRLSNHSITGELSM